MSGGNYLRFLHLEAVIPSEAEESLDVAESNG
jgi:hypothetical protein